MIDPADHPERIADICKSSGLTPAAILLTHGHFDHIMAAEGVKNAFGIPVYAGAEEKKLLSDPLLNGSAMIGENISMTADQWLNDGDILELAGFRIDVIATPGHTAGSVCYYFRDENILISGDTLFCGGIGRTDLPTGSYPSIVRSIGRKLLTLPRDTKVYPGHDEPTDIASESRRGMV